MLLLQPGQDDGDFTLALALVVAIIAFGKTTQMSDKSFPVRQSVGAGAVHNTNGGASTKVRGRASSCRITSLILLYQAVLPSKKDNAAYHAFQDYGIWPKCALT
jgi:hypothetical protein